MNKIDSMKRKDVINILHSMQKYRRGKTKTMPYTPKEFGNAIDYAIRELRNQLKKEKENEQL